MECSVCSETMNMTGSNNEPLASTSCGHIYHEKCLNDWVIGQNKKSCPICRKPSNESNFHQIFLAVEPSREDKDKKFDVMLTRLSDVEIEVKKSNKRHEEMFLMMEKVTENMSAFEFQNQTLRAENAEMKELIKGLEAENRTVVKSKNDSVGLQAQVKTKDLTIANLQKEITDLKSQRAETTNEMSSIREQINQLKQTAKGNKRPLQVSNEQKPQPLTLKFDDFNDKLIFE